MKLLPAFVFCCLLIQTQPACAKNPLLVGVGVVKSGAEQMDKYVGRLKNKQVGLVVNQASQVGNRHLVDTLSTLDISIKRIFTPEHGFRGDADAGSLIEAEQAAHDHYELVSLYGKKKKPEAADLKDLDVVVFDLQDVGVRFYTYISTLSYVMEACAEHGVPLIVLDRPNPNGFYIDGPVLEPGFESFVGLHPVPVVYGLTIGEYGLMVNGEGWLMNKVHCDYSVVPLAGYERNMICKLAVKPSPNLPDWKSVFLYPTLCFFEGTIMSVGRGTEVPFQVFGHPDYVAGSFVFKPRSIAGASQNPPYKDVVCYGQNLSGLPDTFTEEQRRINLFWLLTAFKLMSPDHSFFNSYFNTLAGNAALRSMIESGKSEEEIRANWKPGIEKYKKIRIKYLLYPDFE